MRIIYTMSVMLFAISSIGCLDTRFIPILAERASIFAADYEHIKVPVAPASRKDKLSENSLPQDSTEFTIFSNHTVEPSLKYIPTVLK